MNPRTDHYTFLRVTMDAPPSVIAAAIDRIKLQADALRATSPAQAALIYEKLNRAEADLLSGPERREGYNRWLMTPRGPDQHTAVAPLQNVPPGYSSVEQSPAYTSVMPQQPAAGERPPSSNNWWLIPLIAIVALLVGAAGAYAAAHIFGTSGHAAVSATVTAAPTATTQPAPTGTPLPQATATPASQSTPATAAPSIDPLTADPAVIKQKGYTPVEGRAQTSDGAGGTLYAWAAICTDSADGHCQKVFFFDGTRYLGTDTLNDSTSITGVSEAGPQTIAVTYGNFLPSDPLCCPSGKPVVITYHWTGTRLIPSGTPPGH